MIDLELAQKYFKKYQIESQIHNKKLFLCIITPSHELIHVEVSEDEIKQRAIQWKISENLKT